MMTNFKDIFKDIIKIVKANSTRTLEGPKWLGGSSKSWRNVKKWICKKIWEFFVGKCCLGKEKINQIIKFKFLKFEDWSEHIYIGNKLFKM